MDLTLTLLEEDHGMLAQLKKIQVEEFASEIESQMEVVDKASESRTSKAPKFA
jgi:hypothetical protein